MLRWLRAPNPSVKPTRSVASAPEGSWGGGVRVWQITSGDRTPHRRWPPPQRANVDNALNGTAICLRGA
jgi:hypothetical protein